jgi:AcrR family transcriptional regulator
VPVTDDRGRRNPAATREALLRAATALFSERGFDGVPIDAVAERAGVNKALISYHFRGKHGLYVEVLVSVFAEMADRLKALESEGSDARTTLHRLIETFSHLGRDRPHFPALFLREVLSRGIEPAVLPLLTEIIGVTRRLARRGARDGTFRKVDPVAMHLALVGGIVFFLATEPARRRAAAEGGLPFPMPDLPAFLRYLEDLTLRGLAPDRSRPRRKGARR